MNKYKFALSLFAAIAALAGAAIAIAYFFKVKADKISEKLDFYGDFYYEDDEDEECFPIEEKVEE